MAQRPGDKDQSPEGGHAAERLRQFRQAREPQKLEGEPAENQPAALPEGEQPLEEASESKRPLEEVRRTEEERTMPEINENPQKGDCK